LASDACHPARAGGKGQTRRPKGKGFFKSRI
jgi:hypothetical protein